MKTLLIHGADEPPSELRHIVRAGSTEVQEVARADDRSIADADRIVIWNGRSVIVEDRHLQWPDDRDELKLLFQTGG